MKTVGGKLICLLNEYKNNLVTLYGWDKVGPILSNVCGQEGEETLQLLIFLKDL